MFDSVLRPQQARRHLRSGALVSLVAHSCALMLVTFVRQPVAPLPAPPPPAAPPTRKAVRPKVKAVKRRPLVPRAIVAPKVVPAEKPPEALPEEPPADEDAVEGGEVGGLAGGFVGGVQGGTVGAPPANVRIEFNDAMTPPAMISGPSPQYTQKALDREVQGVMIVKCVITLEGVVRECRVLQGLPFMDRAVVEALERRRYRPALLQGRPVEVDYTFKIRLRLPQ
jgi:periplasmic protein TonB